MCGQFDVGLVYDEPRHALINKWLLLSNPAEASDGVKGFLKICAAVIGPNDDAPVRRVMFMLCESNKNLPELKLIGKTSPVADTELNILSRVNTSN